MKQQKHILDLPVATDLTGVWTPIVTENGKPHRVSWDYIQKAINNSKASLTNAQNTFNSIKSALQSQLNTANNTITTLQNSNNNLTDFKDWSKQIADSHNCFFDLCIDHHPVATDKGCVHGHNFPGRTLTVGHHYFLWYKIRMTDEILTYAPDAYFYVALYDKDLLPRTSMYSNVQERGSGWHEREYFFEFQQGWNNDTYLFMRVCSASRGDVNRDILSSQFSGTFMDIEYIRLYDLDVAPTETLQSLHNSISSLNSQVSTLTTDRNKWKKMYEDHMSTHSTSGGGTTGGGTTTGKWYIKCYDCGYEWGPFNSEADARTKEQLLNSDLGKKDMCDGNHSGDEGYTHYTTYVYQK